MNSNRMPKALMNYRSNGRRRHSKVVANNDEDVSSFKGCLKVQNHKMS